jgi:glutamate synthase domain-containing protein 2
MSGVIPKKELHSLMKRFFADKNRGISIALFAELAGCSKTTIEDCFIFDKMPISETTQRRVSKAYEHYLNGNVAIMQNRDLSRFVKYRDKPQPHYVKSQRISVVNGEVKISLGIKNRRDYSQESLDEQLKRG